MRIHIFQHVAFEGPGCIKDWALQHGHTLHYTHWYQHPAPPDMAQVDLLIIMGGPMGVYDENEYSWMQAEKACIQAAIQGQKRILGICLGAQLLAAVLGARVYPNTQKEIGWFPLQLSPAALPGLSLPSSLHVFHWHGDTFDLPEKAVRFASTTITPNQAFAYGAHIIGLQFHFEVTEESMEDMLVHGAEELVAGTFIQEAAVIRGHTQYIQESNELMYRLLDYLIH